MGRKLNAEQKQARLAADLRLFVQEYGRKAHKGHDPNDRGYDREIEDRVKRMRPEELNRLLEDDEEA